MTYEKIGRWLLAFAFIACASNLWAANSALDEAAQVLEQESGLKVRAYSTRDFGREEYSGARSVVVEEARAVPLLKSVRAHLPKGYVAFIGTQRSLAEPPVNGAEIVVGPGQSQFDILRIAASDAINYGKEAEDLIKVLQGWDHQIGIDIYAAQTDTIQLKLTSRPKDLKAFAEAVYKFCPDIVDQGTGSVDDLAKEIDAAQEVYLWWD